MSTVDISANSPQNPRQSELVKYLSEYAVVNSAWNRLTQSYQTVKQSNSYLKSGIELAETTTSKVLDSTQPYFRKFDDYYHLSEYVDNKGVQTLKKVESGALQLKEKAEESRDKVFQAYETTKEKGQAILVRANRPINHLLDVTGSTLSPLPCLTLLPELVIDKILPGSELVENVDQPVPPDASESGEDFKLHSNPIPRAAALSRDVSCRMKNVALTQFNKLRLRSPVAALELTHVVDLIEYASIHIDAREKATQAKQLLSGTIATADVVRQIVISKARSNVSEVAKIVEQKTSDIKEHSVKATIALVAIIAHSSEILRRRIFYSSSPQSASETREALAKRFEELLDSTSHLVSTFTPEQLREYVKNMNKKSKAAFTSIVNFIKSTLPHPFPSLSSSPPPSLASKEIPLVEMELHLPDEGVDDKEEQEENEENEEDEQEEERDVYLIPGGLAEAISLEPVSVNEDGVPYISSSGAASSSEGDSAWSEPGEAEAIEEEEEKERNENMRE